MAKQPPVARSAEEVEALYHAHGRALWTLLYAHCCDRELARDAMQEAFLRLQQHDGAPIRDLRAWLVSVGRNWLRDRARREHRFPASDLSVEVVSKDGEEPAQLLETSELQSQVRDALARLRTADREVLVLRYALDWPSQRIAEEIGTTAAAVDMRLSRARRRLAQSLDRVGVDRETV